MLTRPGIDITGYHHIINRGSDRMNIFRHSVVLSKSKSLKEHFMDVESKQERNSAISLAYAEDGYSQIEIASFLGLSKSAISMIIKSSKSED
ncbi:MAG: hypothetical protein U9R27_03685 [Campylobacterota bacterium]|nr:hypothetical protein [Campylobacterota bacterium]